MAQLFGEQAADSISRCMKTAGNPPDGGGVQHGIGQLPEGLWADSESGKASSADCPRRGAVEFFVLVGTKPTRVEVNVTEIVACDLTDASHYAAASLREAARLDQNAEPGGGHTRHVAT